MGNYSSLQVENNQCDKLSSARIDCGTQVSVSMADCASETCSTDVKECGTQSTCTYALEMETKIKEENRRSQHILWLKKKLDTKDDQIHDLHKEMGAVKDRERHLRLELNYLIKENEHLRNDASMLHNKVAWWEKKNRVEEETRKKELFEKKQREEELLKIKEKVRVEEQERVRVKRELEEEAKAKYKRPRMY